jgi:hypothetical protein
MATSKALIFINPSSEDKQLKMKTYYPSIEEYYRIDEGYRNAHWCPRCLAMFEEECLCDEVDEDDEDY